MIKDCAVAGCTRVAQTAGLCQGHYNRRGHYGDVQADIPLPLPPEQQRVPTIGDYVGFGNAMRSVTAVVIDTKPERGWSCVRFVSGPATPGGAWLMNSEMYLVELTDAVCEALAG